MQILVTDGLTPLAIEALSREHEVTAVELNPAELLERISSFHALIVRSRTKVTKEVILRGKQLRVIGRSGVGVDNIDVTAATAQRVVVVYAPTGSTVSVAELAIGHMLSLSRMIPQADRSVRAGKWEKGRFVGHELQGKTLGLIGSGRIGAEVARRAQAFGMQVIAFDPYLKPEDASAREIRLSTLDAVLATSDFISVHAALTEETRGMIDASAFFAMKETACLINCARGEIVNEEDLSEALRSRRIRGAALDVYQEEPPTHSPLLDLENVIFTPHIGASTEEAQERTSQLVAQEVLLALSGKKPNHAVNPEVLG